jgi:xanthine/CO dehydrogenase XdhC/CoxF family maturation factor
MRERRRIVEMWRRGGAAAMVTLIRVEGSSYRRVGAKLLIGGNGEYAGSVSGGCLEAEVVRRAQWLVRQGAAVQRYSTLFDDTAEIPYGLGCGGVVDLLLEPAGTAEFEALMRAMEVSLNGTAVEVKTWLPVAGSPLRRAVNGVLVGDAAADEFVQEAVLDALLPPQRLVVLGAGDDARPVVHLAGQLGWEVVVIDGRAQWVTRERFPEAGSVMCAGKADAGLLRPDDAVVLMTHSYEQDREWLAAALPAGVKYLGLLGARRRSALLVSEAAAMLGWSVERACEGLFAPVGLDLGGDGAESIALAVIAEVHAFCEGKLGASRRMSAEVVSEQVAKGGASRYLQTQCAL